MFFQHLFLLFATTLCVRSSPLGVVHERRNEGSVEGQGPKREIEHRDAAVSVRIHLTQRNLERGYDHVLQVSEPQSDSYGRFWNKEDVAREFAPEQSAVDGVLNWLSTSGIETTRLASDKGSVLFDAPLWHVEELLTTRYYEYEDNHDGVLRLGCDAYSLPEHIGHHIDYITPGVTLSPPVRLLRSKRANFHTGRDVASSEIGIEHHQCDDAQEGSLAGCSKCMTPTCVRALYDIPKPGTKPAAVDFGIYQSLGSKYNQENNDEFFTRFAPYVPNGTHPKLVSINGATAPAKNKDDASSEADLDFQVAYGILGDVDLKLFQVGLPKGYKGNKEYNDALVVPMLDAIDGSFCSEKEKQQGFDCGTASLSKVVSMSFGLPELFVLTAAKQKRVCNELMKLALQGYTIVASSGDFGVATSSNYNDVQPTKSNGCVPQNLDNTGRHKFNGTIYVPDFPATCPYVLAVGATQLEPGQSVSDEESAMWLPHTNQDTWSKYEWFSSGGGFSNYFTRPKYQEKALAHYFSAHDPGHKSYESNAVDVLHNASTTIGKNGSIYNSVGRGFPDVSANGVNYAVYWLKYLLLDAGTSAATPLWGSIVAMLNAERAAIGKGPVGFIQPVLYQHPEVFHDIRNGSNPGCDSTGFAAVEGWDPVTGLGTPNFPKLKDLFLSLP